MCAGLFTKIFGEIDDPQLTRTRTFQINSASLEEENEYDLIASRRVEKPCGVFASIMTLVKAALGGGVLSGHVAYMKAGVITALPLNIILGFYMTYCLHIQILILATQRLCRRTRVPAMSYPDAGEAAFSCFNSLIARRLALQFRYCIDATIMLDLFGACATYQIIMAKTAKQLVENVQTTTLEEYGSYPHIRAYLAAFLIPLICICLITHLKWLTPLNTIANLLILMVVGITIQYAYLYNPHCKGLKKHSGFTEVFGFIGVIVFSMSNAGLVLPVENQMKNPLKFPLALYISMIITVFITITMSFFGYMAFLDKSEIPITFNLPMTMIPKIFKGAMAFMMYVTHALNFWVPFNLCWYYLKQNHKSRFTMWELIYRTIIVTLIVLVAIIFPSITAIMGFLGTFCLSNMALIWPNLIYLLVIWERPGLGKCHWRLWLASILISIGLIVLIAGTIVSVVDLLNVFKNVRINRRPSQKGEIMRYKKIYAKINKFL